MKELKDYLLDQISYLEHYNPTLVCYGPSMYEITLKRKVFQEVLDKLREIEKENKKSIGDKK